MLHIVFHNQNHMFLDESVMEKMIIILRNEVYLRILLHRSLFFLSMLDRIEVQLTVVLDPNNKAMAIVVEELVPRKCFNQSP
jgi:hypothetical protein